MIRILLLAVSLPLLFVGGEGLYHVARNSQRTVMSCERFARERPKIAWIRLVNCDLDYVGAGYRESGGRITELLFPVRPAGQQRTVPAAAIVSTRDPNALQIAERTIGGQQRPNQEAFLVMMLTIVTALKASREVDGHARVGFIDGLNARRVVSGLAGPIDPSATLIDLRQRPSIRVPALEAAAGALAFFAFLFLQFRGRRRLRSARAADLPIVRTPQLADLRAAEIPALEAPRPPGSLTPRPPGSLAPGPRRLRGLMLLNLSPDHGVERIEDAPPLGPRADVLQTLASVLPGIRADENGRCTVKRPDYSVTVSIGTDDTVATAVVDSQGEAAVAAVQSILRATGWRAFAPRRGAFIDAAHLHAVTEPAP
jgi:hypothetical protein